MGDYFISPETVYADPTTPLPLNITKYITELRSTIRQIMTVVLGTEARVDDLCFPAALMYVTRVQRMNSASPLAGLISTRPRTRCVSCSSDSPSTLCGACNSPRLRRSLSQQKNSELADLRTRKLALEIKCGRCMNQTSEPLADADFTCVSPSCSVRLQRAQNNSWQACARKTLRDIEDLMHV